MFLYNRAGSSILSFNNHLLGSVLFPPEATLQNLVVVFLKSSFSVSRSCMRSFFDVSCYLNIAGCYSAAHDYFLNKWQPLRSRSRQNISSLSYMFACKDDFFKVRLR